MKKEENERKNAKNNKEQGSIGAINTSDKYQNGKKNEIITDPFGSWTGTPTDGKYEKPVQDVDDL